jgi:hypothetical protein
VKIIEKTRRITLESVVMITTKETLGYRAIQGK